MASEQGTEIITVRNKRGEIQIGSVANSVRPEELEAQEPVPFSDQDRKKLGQRASAEVASKKRERLIITIDDLNS